MGNITLAIAAMFFIVMFFSPLYSHDNFRKYSKSKNCFNRNTREHIRLLQTQKAEDLLQNFRTTESVYFNESFKKSLKELKNFHSENKEKFYYSPGHSYGIKNEIWKIV